MRKIAFVRERPRFYNSNIFYMKEVSPEFIFEKNEMYIAVVLHLYI